MSRRWLLSLLCLSAAVVFVQLSAANSELRVNEAATRFLIQDQTVVTLEVNNPTPQHLPAHLKLELLDPEDSIRGLAIRDLTLRAGVNKLVVPLTFTANGLTKNDKKMLPWYRIRYRIETAPEAKSAIDAAHGVISLSEIDTPDIFAIEVSAPTETHRGARHSTHVRAFHPITRKPVKDVKVNVELELDDDAPEKTLRGSGTTDDAGYAMVTLNIPARVSDDEGELKVVARHGGYVKEASNDVEINDNARIMVTTDKPIYQPGQPLHVRALVFNSANRAAVNAKAILKITDPENTNVFQATLLTSRFGVANADWTIPENTRLGDYAIDVEVDSENYGDSRGYQSVKISRYDLPNFAVNAQPDRAYYLPQQNADIEVRADYLFGQPVKRGHVRVVREERREWNFREQKWDIEGGDHYEGETDETGRFVAHVDLQKDHDNLADQGYLRFTDLTYAAYFTDPTTNRTEQRRFDLRVTKDAIHIYVAEGRNRQAQGFPLQFYLVTSFADGTPAPCEVGISESPDDEDEARRITPVLRTIRTNKYGIAKVAGLQLPGAVRVGNPSLDFTAHNAGGATGHHTESFYFREVPVIRVETDKALYRPGEPITLSISASEPEMNMIVAVSRAANIIESRSLALHNGAATVSLSYRPEFQDEVSISAYSRAPEHSNAYDLPFGSRTVLFPRDRDLKLNVHMDHADYKPGQDATVDFRVSTPDGRPANSALGIVIFDRAVEERARTDQEFRGGFGFYSSFREWRGYDDQVAGITRKDLQRINLTKPLPDEMELVAELLLGADSVRPEFFEAEEFEKNSGRVFAELTALQFKPIAEVLETQYKNAALYPANGETLRRLLFESRIDFDQLKDPWGTLYREVFSIDRDDNVLEVISAGPDKVFGTKDDFSLTRIARPYFRFTGEAINRAVQSFHSRTGGFIRDAATLKTELRSEGIDFDSLRDPWGQHYNLNFTIRKDRFFVTVRSGGADKRFEDGNPKADDFTLWITSIDYMIETRARLDKALGEYFQETNSLPGDDRQLQQAFAAAAVEQEQLHDPWGQRFYAVYKTEYGYGDRSTIQSFATYGQQAKERLETIPVTQQVSSINLRSSGEDGKEGTADDFNVAAFSRLTAEEVGRDEIAPSYKQAFFSGAKGAINGTVVDPAGGVIAGVTVKATLRNLSQEFATQTNEEGRFLLRNLPVGYYELRCEASSFKSAIVTEVPVSSSNITTIDFTLYPGNISETVTVTGAADMDQTTSAVASTISAGRLRVSIAQPIQLTTPRLREYFPETLVWQPSLESDKEGRAQLKFKLADNITTWKMSVIGSTEDGEIGTAETEIRSFQPFFVEHDPPRILTEGDQISLPVVLRNYLEREQTVDLEMKPESWFTLQGPAQQRANVPAGDAARQTFDLKAVASVKDGKQRVTARGFEASDAIEKPVTVHPDGEEKTQTSSDLLSESVTLDLNLPASVIPGSVHAELKVYPSLMAHVVESVEGILERPHGCGEQTISSTYPSLLLLRRTRETKTTSRIGAKAQGYAELGYQRLLNYRTADGGFSYWGRGDADLALTAYALRFLHDAREFVAVDDEVVKGTRAWLIKQQRVDGSWPAHDYSTQETEDQRRTALLTAFVARVLAMTESAPKRDGVVPAKQLPVKAVSTELQRALSYLSTKTATIDEPYLFASYALAAIDAGDTQGATRAATKLRALAHNEAGKTYWSLETNTPFYGWGLAGRVETTALVVQALHRLAKIQSEQATASAGSTDMLVRSGLLFLLKEKDRYGVWYSTQATINVLDTLITLLTTGDASSAPVQIIVDGQLATALNLPAGEQSASLIRVDISRFLHQGASTVELRRAAGSAFVSVQLVANYYVPWSESDAAPNGERKTAASSLRLAARFDHTTAQINEEIVCHVKAERVGFRGYGMMLAEIGLPPGADVDRASLESAMKNSAWAINQYDVLPDRLVVYLWARAGGVEFDFKFRPRFALTAKTAPSVVYDYYNPEARDVVPPATFIVK